MPQQRFLYRFNSLQTSRVRGMAVSFLQQSPIKSRPLTGDWLANLLPKQTTIFLIMLATVHSKNAGGRGCFARKSRERLPAANIVRCPPKLLPGEGRLVQAASSESSL